MIFLLIMCTFILPIIGLGVYLMINSIIEMFDEL
jgi:hypothetical protein